MPGRTTLYTDGTGDLGTKESNIRSAPVTPGARVVLRTDDAAKSRNDDCLSSKAILAKTYMKQESIAIGPENPVREGDIVFCMNHRGGFVCGTITHGGFKETTIDTQGNACFGTGVIEQDLSLLDLSRGYIIRR